MKLPPILLTVILLATSTNGSEIAQCDPTPEVLKPVDITYPSYEEVKEMTPGTSYAHAMVEGHVVVGFIITTAGVVEAPQIIESSAFSKTYRRSYDGFFDKTAIRIASNLRYEERAAACRSSIKFTWKADAA